MDEERELLRERVLNGDAARCATGSSISNGQFRSPKEMAPHVYGVLSVQTESWRSGTVFAQPTNVCELGHAKRGVGVEGRSNRSQPWVQRGQGAEGP